MLRIRIEALRVARSANITTQASGGRRPQQQPGILRFYAEETPGLKIGPTTVRGRVAFVAVYSLLPRRRIDGVATVYTRAPPRERDRTRARRATDTLTPTTHRSSLCP